MATLNELLQSLREADEDIEQSLTQEQLKETIGSIKDKVDSTFEVISRLESEASRMDRLAKSFEKRKKTLSNQVKSLKEYVQYTMATDGSDELYGETHRVKLCSRKGLKVTDQVGAETTMKFPDVVKVEYSFDKMLVKEKYKADPEKYGELVEETKTQHIKFSVR